MSEMADAIRTLAEEKGISQDSIKQTIENTIKAAYKRTYGTADNCIVKFNDDLSDVSVYSRKVIVDGVYDPSIEIELEEAQEMAEGSEIGDTIDILVDPHNFARSAVNTGKQTAHQTLNESFKDNLYNEYKDKIGGLILGYYQRERNGNIYVDIGKVEGVLPQKFQSPREVYQKNDRIRALAVELKKTASGLQVILSRTDANLVRYILEGEVPEIGEGIVGIHNIVREAGYRTKIAVYSNKEDIDPVGACVGLKGIRIQSVIRDLEGEKIDVINYNEDPREFIKNALSPAEVKRVVIKDSEKKMALAIVDESNLALAVGKGGLNVRLANKLCDWSIDVKNENEVLPEDLIENDTRKAAETLFSDANEEDYEQIETVAQLSGVDQRVAGLLKDAGLDDIETFVAAYDDGTAKNVEGITEEEIEAVYKIISETVEFEDEEEPAAEEETADEEEPEYVCPECGAKITLDMTRCPKCGVEFEFADASDEADE